MDHIKFDMSRFSVEEKALTARQQITKEVMEFLKVEKEDKKAFGMMLRWMKGKTPNQIRHYMHLATSSGTNAKKPQGLFVWYLKNHENTNTNLQ